MDEPADTAAMNALNQLQQYLVDLTQQRDTWRRRYYEAINARDYARAERDNNRWHADHQKLG